jgi:NAD(P)-dependent dehydrogenase (short-subunit alcohol dehydrogenase family)
MGKQSVAIVTGGGKGIGQAIARRLARAGMAVVIGGLDPDELSATADELKTDGAQCLCHVTDVANEEQVDCLVEEARGAFGRIDVLVNNAAIVGPTAPVASLRREDWDEVLAVNLTGAMLCCKAVLPIMMRQRGGHIINISSIAGKIGYQLRSPYAVSKWGLLGLTVTLAKEVGPYNILVNAICPGPVTGPRMEHIIEERAKELGQSREEVEKYYLHKTLLGRMVNAEHVADLVAFLTSPAGGSMTGQVIDITAGYGL